ncbi:hypothetical protein [Legionella gresilensis]|uniref:hypothetical protein n=1 Tax=Legionella gresilensis TaxID=91823 RepID=UPI00104152A7|nr:hypothetical protein [Legionella gresilensis]
MPPPNKTLQSTQRQIVAQAKEKNKKLTQAQQHVKLNSDNNNDEGFTLINKLTDVDAFSFEPTTEFNLDKIRQQYHQVLRDSLTGLVKTTLLHANLLIRDLINELRTTPIISPSFAKTGININNLELTKATQLLEEDINLISLDCDKENSIFFSLNELIKFKKILKEAAVDYYNLEREKLTVNANQEFCQHIAAAVESYEYKIYHHLSGTCWSRKFGELMSDILNLYASFNFQRHLNSVDFTLETKEKYNYAIPHTNPEVMPETIGAWREKKSLPSVVSWPQFSMKKSQPQTTEEDIKSPSI